MSLFFILNNFHFALEALGALAFFIVSWFAFDAFRLRRDFLTASRGVGFLSLGVWQIIHAFGFTSNLWPYAGYAFYIFGLFMVVLNLILERPAPRPEFKAILILPALAVSETYANMAASFLYFFIALFSFRQYKGEFKKALKPFWIGFSFLFLGSFSSIFYDADSLGSLWILGHGFEVAGFLALVWWVWQYLQLRIREELVLILISGSMLISIVVTSVFSIILVGQIEKSASASLLTNARVLDLRISSLKEEALAKTKFISSRSDLAEAMAKNDFQNLQKLAESYLEKEKLGFLLITDKNGEVALRAHSLAKKEDDLSHEKAIGEAIRGLDFVEIEYSEAEKFSIRAASPLISKGKPIGAVVGGFLLDNAFLDNMKGITGLEATIYYGDKVVATTLLDLGGRSRSTGIKLVDAGVKAKVLDMGEEIVLRMEILSRPAVASFIPIKNSDDKAIGMLSSVKPQREILELAQSVNRLTLMTVTILMLILALPIYFFTKRLSGEVV